MIFCCCSCSIDITGVNLISRYWNLDGATRNLMQGAQRAQINQFDTIKSAKNDKNLEILVFGLWPWRGQCPVEYWGSFACWSIHLSICSPLGLQSLKFAISGLQSTLLSLESALSGTKSVLSGLKSALSDLKFFLPCLKSALSDMLSVLDLKSALLGLKSGFLGVKSVPSGL